MNGFSELRRRHVHKVGAANAVHSGLPFFDVPNAAVRWVVIAVVSGFPGALAWLAHEVGAANALIGRLLGNKMAPEHTHRRLVRMTAHR